MKIDPRIIKFLKKHHVLTLATFGSGVWCCNLFYAYVDRGNLDCDISIDDKIGDENSSGGSLIFTSKPQTRHICDGLGKSVAASVVLESKIVGNLQGTQIVGLLRAGTDSEKIAYLKRFPYAVLGLEEIYAIDIIGVKFTDNKLGFGTKLYCGTFKS